MFRTLQAVYDPEILFSVVHYLNCGGDASVLGLRIRFDGLPMTIYSFQSGSIPELGPILRTEYIRRIGFLFIHTYGHI